MSKESGGPYNRKYRVILTEQTWFITWQIGYAKNRTKNEFLNQNIHCSWKKFKTVFQFVYRLQGLCRMYTCSHAANHDFSETDRWWGNVRPDEVKNCVWVRGIYFLAIRSAWIGRTQLKCRLNTASLKLTYCVFWKGISGDDGISGQIGASGGSVSFPWNYSYMKKIPVRSFECYI